MQWCGLHEAPIDDDNARQVARNTGTIVELNRHRQYGCASAPAVLAGSHRYAGPYHIDDVGTYRMQGARFVALSGSDARPRNSAEILYVPPAGDRKAAVHIAFIEASGKPSTGLWCVAK